MKIIKTASGKKIHISRSEWLAIGKKAGWEDVWEDRGDRAEELYLEDDKDEIDPEEEAYRMLFKGDEPQVEEDEIAEEGRELEETDLSVAADQAKQELSEILETQMERPSPAPAAVLAEAILQAAQDYLDLKGVDIYASAPELDIVADFMDSDTADPNEAVVKALIKRILATAEERGAATKVRIRTASAATTLTLDRETWAKIGRRAGWDR